MSRFSLLQHLFWKRKSFFIRNAPWGAYLCVTKSRLLFLVGLLFCLTPFASPPLALAAGLVFAFVAVHPWPAESRKVSKTLLQASVVALGFGMNLQQVLRAGRSGFIYTAIGITFALTLGMILGRVMRVQPTSAFLISAGTAICGGSAIAAVGPIAGASEDEMSVSLGTVFILNSVALLTFPFIGTTLHLSQSQFGLWAALAIHDTSSVVGAASKYGAAALAIATTVKLARALWIVPLSFGTATVKRTEARIQWPWFIAFFSLAAVLNTYIVRGKPLFTLASHAGVVGLSVTLFLIGASLSPKKIENVGARPLIQGIALWIIVATVSLLCIRWGWIGL
jgi:uncharacterized integral membrane protein (TIGR00698 family)